jgi:hypothetical protein
MAVSTLARQSEDKYTRQAYQRRLDDIYYYNKEKYEYEQKLAATERDLAISESTVQDLVKQIAELKSRLSED